MPRSLLIVICLAALASWAWRAHVDDADGERLAALVQAGDIRMISSETCGWCTAARRWMTEQNLPFEECFIEREARCQAEYEALEGYYAGEEARADAAGSLMARGVYRAAADETPP